MLSLYTHWPRDRPDSGPITPIISTKNKNKNNLPLTYFTVQLLNAIGIPSCIIRAVHNFVLLFPGACRFETNL